MKVHFDLTCPRCGHSDLELANGDPKGWASRERRLIVSCNKRYCAWSGVVIVELIDINAKRSVA